MADDSSGSPRESQCFRRQPLGSTDLMSAGSATLVSAKSTSVLSIVVIIIVLLLALGI